MYAWNNWMLRVYLMGGMALIAFDGTNRNLGLGVLRGLDVYLILAGFYFLFNSQRRVEKRWQEIVALASFPGAFVASLFPLYTALLLIARYFHS
jgi:hypothetical protein